MNFHVAADWGDIPTWVSAIGTLVALAFAAVAARSAIKVYEIESRRDRVHADERKRQLEFVRRAQAAMVSAWWGTQTGSDGVSRWGAFVRNASETPIYQTRVSVVKVFEPDISDSFGISVLPPTADPAFYPSTVWVSSAAERDVPDFRVEMTFTDSVGIRWIRDQQGKLAEVFPELRIWADSHRSDRLELFTSDFLSTHQVTAAFNTPPIERMQDDFIAAVVAGESPDLLLGPHDWIGNLVERGLLDPIPLPFERRAAFVDRAIEAMTYRGKVYGLPYAADSVALVRNVDLAPHAPATFEDMLAHGRSLCAEGRTREPLTIQVGTGDGFHIYPLFTSAGGNIFAHTPSGTWDRSVIMGEGTAAAFRRISELGHSGEAILRLDVDRWAALALFSQGETPYLVCPPWAIRPARDAGVRLAVSPVPPFTGGAPARSLVAVNGLFLPSAGRNKTVVRELVLDSLTRMDVAEALYQSQPRPPALAAAAERFYAVNADTDVYRHQFENSELIPSGADVASMWANFHKAEVDLVSGGNVERILREFSRSVDRLNEGLS